MNLKCRCSKVLKRPREISCHAHPKVSINIIEIPTVFLNQSALFIDIIARYRDIIYRTSAKNVGTEAAKIVPERPVLYGTNMRFSAHLSASGNYVNNGLNTCVPKDRNNDNARDW